ncbi:MULTISPECIES: cytochrome c biogenesis CcdA family protein [Exiguobacterium]|uniref:cytochrome c biogenesis CcdA family protein n=1 Tax=Exiguobacterium TaxID=33986 RepID=UPI0004484A26|nr:MULTISPECIES: cytochrome c biogenesis protein CcdA [Exiguobacterium]EZP61668.1 Cytochrome c biogenesis protein transmembrane region [Exiguobacterium sp. RIT341]KQS44961.1 cytochrome C biogenesis protein [Exiguobacterium sp. Leaf196]MDQ6466288.1 cytochrome c biogenesis protein CcdA [Exiguobacterium acetylicum]MDT0171788.1 cytochrome c biogenesis protein CcdA [Exiguobacterium sp. BRG2]HAB33279.1 cytochrome C biogenesis protein CcdA [Exiguobacterium sp.]
MELSLWLAFGAGLLSFVSPCTLPLYPVFLSYITGVSVTDLKERGVRERRSLFHTLAFLVGFAMVFAVLGLSTSLFADVFITYRDTLRMVGALVIFVFGVVLVGLWQPTFLMREKKLNLGERKGGYVGTVLVGIGFAAGWTPCTGPILAGVIGLAATNPSQGMFYMLAYVLGFSIPFLLMAFFVGRSRLFVQYSLKLTKFGGALMMVFGVMLYFDGLSKFAAWMSDIVGFTGF